MPTRVLSIGSGFRLLLGALGLIAITTGITLATLMIRSTWPRPSTAWIAAAFFAVVAISGGTVVRSAVRGRIRVRASATPRQILPARHAPERPQP